MSTWFHIMDHEQKVNLYMREICKICIVYYSWLKCVYIYINFNLKCLICILFSFRKFNNGTS